MNSQQTEKLREEFREEFGLYIHDTSINTIADWWLSKFDAYTKEIVDKVEENISEYAKKLADAAPEGDWYLLPPRSERVVGYIKDETIGDIAYKGKPMNVKAIIEEAVLKTIALLQDTSK